MKRGTWSDVYTTPPPPEFLCGSDGIQKGMTRVGPKSAIFATIDLGPLCFGVGVFRGQGAVEGGGEGSRDEA